MITFVLIFGSIVLLGGLANNGVNMPQLPGWLAAALPAVFALVSVGGFALSFAVSLGIYDRKEF